MFEQLSLTAIVAVFLATAALVGICGVLLTARAERLARITGLGQAIMGAVFIGATTSLAGLTTTISAAWDGHAPLAVSNCFGGIAAQTVFLAIADLTYKKANLEHAAASEANLIQGVLLIILLSIPLMAVATPELALLSVHPVSIVLPLAYLFGVSLVFRAHKLPMWRPRITRETEKEEKKKKTTMAGTATLWIQFGLLAAAVTAAGWVLAETGVLISDRVGIKESVVGGVFTAISTSLPELVVALAAVHRGALTLAVGDVLGGNIFDVLFLAAADVAFRGGSLYAAIGSDESLWLAVSILMAGVLLLGLLRREKHGVANIGFESILILVIYAAGLSAITLS